MIELISLPSRVAGSMSLSLSASARYSGRPEGTGIGEPVLFLFGASAIATSYSSSVYTACLTLALLL
jgi:hypothetical protein